MDSLTQILLGASVSYGILGKTTKSVKVPLILGAVIGTVPDLDVIFRYGDPMDNFVYHRGWSHSILMHFLMAPILFFLARFCSKAVREIGKVRLLVAIYLILATHALLDAMTVYGTQLFWPYTDMNPISIGSVFIIDPLYTIPLLLGILGVMVAREEKKAFYNFIGFTVGFFYLFIGLTSQAYVQKHTIYNLIEQEIAFENYKVVPTPFNTFLWRIIVRNEGEYKIAYMSIFDEDKTIHFETYKTRDDLPLEDDKHFKKVDHFTNGFFKVSLTSDNEVILSDLRMGAEKGYVFSFAIGTYNEQSKQFIPYDISRRVSVERGRKSYIDKIWARIWNKDVVL